MSFPPPPPPPPSGPPQQHHHEHHQHQAPSRGSMSGHPSMMEGSPPSSSMSSSSASSRLLSLLHEGDRCLAEAQVLLKRSIKIKEILRPEGQSLVDSYVLMRTQVSVVSKLLLWIWDQNGAYLSRLEALLSHDKSFQQIDEICKQLEASKVDAELVAGEEGHTLYDFVDDTSVSSLKLEAQVALKEMLALHDKGLSAQLVLEERQLYFKQVITSLGDALGCCSPPAVRQTSSTAPTAGAVSDAGEGREQGEAGSRRGGAGDEGGITTTTVLEDYALWQSIEQNVAQQEQTVEQMKAALLSAASAYSRTARGRGGEGQQPTHPLASSSSSSSSSVVAEEERTLLSVLQASIERMKDLQLAIDRFPHAVHKLRQQMRALLTDFERFQPEATERVHAVKTDQARFSELAEGVQSLLQELVSLAAFYHGFMSAYSELGAEVNRRRRALETVAQSKLNRLFEEEEAERANFYKEHGRWVVGEAR